MKPFVPLAVMALLASLATPAAAHPVPFSYLDLRLPAPGSTTEAGGAGIDATVVLHVYDVAHDLGIEPMERLLDPRFLASQTDRIAALVRSRLSVTADGRLLAPGDWSQAEVLAERQSIQLRTRYTTSAPAGMVAVSAVMFPYDSEHQTFVNMYEGADLASQAILDDARPAFEFFTGTRQGTVAVIRRFVPAGIHHILIGPDHLLFLLGLLLLGGTRKQLLLVVSAFTVAHSITLSLAALGIVTPPARLIEPAIALSIVYVGADNLMVRNGRDVRAWVAFAFGFIHGFGFANVLREMDLPVRALGWSLFSFNFGVEIGQVLVVAIVASALAAVRAHSAAAGRRLAIAGSILVIAAGGFWFVQRVFFPGGMA